ncbi:MAG: phosphoglucomutase/phosphomannomutase family protein [Candidatus Omnitrophota bacterium]
MIKFGTDGWRAVIADEFTFENVKLVAQAIAIYAKRTFGKNIKMAVGFDNRFLSDKFASITAQVIAANDILVFLSDQSVPTPALSLAVKDNKCNLGVMITASHNPAEFNGIKIKTSTGGAAGASITQEVEKIIPTINQKDIILMDKKDIVIKNITKDYIKALSLYINLKIIKRAKFRILVDVMHGSGNTFLKDVLKNSHIEIDFMHDDINPSFGGMRPEPVAEYVQELLKRVKKDKFSAGFVLDGDADRLAAVTEDGEFISPQKILGLLALHLNEDRKLSGGIVKTIVGTTMMDNIAKGFNVKLYETPVGFKYISDLMEREDVVVGGEEAGGMGFKNYIPERDGSLAILLLLEMMAFRNKTLKRLINDMEQKYGRFYYLKDHFNIDGVKFNINDFKNYKNLLGKDVIDVKDSDGVRLTCSDQSWLMMRASGTEPIMRIYSEATTQKRAKELLNFGRELVFSK